MCTLHMCMYAPTNSQVSVPVHLHARALRLPNPGGRDVEIVAELSPHMKQTFEVLGFDEDSAENFFDLRKPRRIR